MLVGSIDLTKIDKNKIVTKDKDGKPFTNGAKYYNIVVWLNDEVDQYGNIASVQESITKEEREGGAKATYIGNLKNIQGQNTNDSTKSQEPKPLGADSEDDNLPF